MIKVKVKGGGGVIFFFCFFFVPISHVITKFWELGEHQWNKIWKYFIVKKHNIYETTNISTIFNLNCMAKNCAP